MPASLLIIFALSLLLYDAFGGSKSFLLNNMPLAPKLPITNSYASQSGQIQLAKDSFGFYVNADLSPNSTGSDFGPNIVSMILGLYTSQTLLADNCLHFSPYNCSQYSCINYTTDSVPVHSPYFTGDSYLAAAAIYLDYSHWNLNTNASIATSCNANTLLPYGLTRYGVIGLGTGGNASGNFIKSPVFSISLSQDLLSGELLFGHNDAINSSRELVATLLANEDWHVNASDCEISVGNNSFVSGANLIFDVNAEAIGLPNDLYSKILEYLSTTVPMNCTTHAYQPVCLYKGTISDLPNITISTQNQTIIIRPATYVQSSNKYNEGSNIITLNIKAISSDLADYSYITSKYNDYIILDGHIMRDYAILFDATSQQPTIKLYGDYLFSHNDSFWIQVIAGAVIFLSVVFCCCFCSFKQYKASDPPIPDIRADDFGVSSKEYLIRPNFELKSPETSPPQRLIRLQRMPYTSELELDVKASELPKSEPDPSIY